MKEYISLDSHKCYSIVERENCASREAVQCRIGHSRGSIREYLGKCEPGTPVAVEAVGNWYWIVQEIEDAKQVPQLVHPRKAKLMMGMINKTDKLDVHGLNRLQRNGTLPTVWIAPGELRDLRELTRTRITVARQRTRLKNRISSTFSKYGLTVEEYSDMYGKKAREELNKLLEQLPPQTKYVTEALLQQLDFVEQQIEGMEKRLQELVKITPAIQLLMTMPGVGFILATAIAWEIGEISRFACAPRLAAYAGTTPRVHASGGKIRYGQMRSDVNHYLKWAFAEAGNSVALHAKRSPMRHVSQLYQRIRDRKGHAKAVGAVSRHLAEATFYILSKQESYEDPALKRSSSREV